MDHADALEAAGDALAVWAHRLGTHGLAFETAARAAGLAAARVTEAALTGMAQTEVEELVAAHAQAMAAVIAELDQVQATEATVRVQLDELRSLVDRSTSEREQATTRALLAEGALRTIRELPYTGAEPAARRIARETLGG